MEKSALELFTNVTFVKRDEGRGCLGILEDRLGRGSAPGGFSPVQCFFTLHPLFAQTLRVIFCDTTETAGFIISINCREGLRFFSVFSVTNSPEAQGASPVPPSILGAKAARGHTLLPAGTQVLPHHPAGICQPRWGSPLWGAAPQAQDRGRDAGFVQHRLCTETSPGLVNLQGQGHVIGKAGEGGARSQTGFIRLMICPYKEGRSESWCTRGPARLLEPAGSGVLSCPQRVKKGRKLVLKRTQNSSRKRRPDRERHKIQQEMNGPSARR